MKILLVDDEPGVLAMIKAMLGNQYEILTTTSPHKAMLLAETNDIDLLVTDIHLGNKTDGHTLASWVHAKRPSIPIIFICGLPEVHPVHGLPCRYMEKPFTKQELIDAIESMR